MDKCKQSPDGKHEWYARLGWSFIACSKCKDKMDIGTLFDDWQSRGEHIKKLEEMLLLATQLNLISPLKVIIKRYERFQDAIQDELPTLTELSGIAKEALKENEK